MIEISCSDIISKVKAMEITKKAELKKLYEEKKHILEDRMDTCTNCKKTVLSYKQTLEISIEKAPEVQIMIEAQKIASQIEKYKQLLRNYRFDGSKILICFGTGIPNAINVFMNSLFKIFISNEVKFLKLLTDERIPVFNSVQKSSLNQSVGYFWNPKEDIKIKLHRPIFGTSLAAQNVGTKSSFSASPTTSPLLDSLLSASTLPDKPLAYPGSMVTSVATGSSVPKGTFSFRQQPFTTGTQSPFSFGQGSSTTPGGGQNLFTSTQKALTTTGSAGFIFPSHQKENTFAGKSSKETSPVKSTPKDCTDEYEPKVDFKPVIDLPDLVETKTGEEEEEVLFYERATLFRFDDGQWKERGTGDLKLSRHEQTQRVRLLMRRDQVLKVCANHSLTKEMKLFPMHSSKKAWCWNAQDFSEGEIQVEQLAVRFKDEDLALKFKTTFKKLQSEVDQVKSNQAQKSQLKQ
ncbi:E3 SUMO-protein ligase RanBP2-like [Mytilus californianus]|uniref:E3 SUMO-protein ligase RanBP2-like n=1 Tax=Mytilus californianus TaxID=6549 RepID=UPI0022450933|nr:E3 SUMO-protein ligase RanBP2-like [Mytilus californianus]